MPYAFCTQNWYIPENVSGYFVSTSCQRSRSVSDQPDSGELAAIVLGGLLFKFKADECQTVLPDECLNGRDRHPRFLHVKQKIAALAGREKIGKAPDAGERCVEQFLAAAPDLVRRRAVAASGNERPRGDHIVTASLTIETEMHRARPASTVTAGCASLRADPPYGAARRLHR